MPDATAYMWMLKVAIKVLPCHLALVLTLTIRWRGKALLCFREDMLLFIVVIWWWNRSQNTWHSLCSEMEEPVGSLKVHDETFNTLGHILYRTNPSLFQLSLRLTSWCAVFVLLFRRHFSGRLTDNSCQVIDLSISFFVWCEIVKHS